MWPFSAADQTHTQAQVQITAGEKGLGLGNWISIATLIRAQAKGFIFGV